MSETKIPLGGALAKAKRMELLRLMKKGEIKMLTYDQSDIQRCLDILNEVTITGIRNCEKIAVAANILMNPLPEEKEEEPDGSCKEEQAEG